MNGQPGIELENVHLPVGRIAPGGPEHVELGQPDLPGAGGGDAPGGGQEQRQVFGRQTHAPGLMAILKFSCIKIQKKTGTRVIRVSLGFNDEVSNSESSYFENITIGYQGIS